MKIRISLAVCLISIRALSLCHAQLQYEPYTFVTIAGNAAKTGAADGTNDAARFNSPGQLVVDPAGNLFVPDGGNNLIRQISPSGNDWVVTTIAGKTMAGAVDGIGRAARFSAPNNLAIDSEGNLYVSDDNNYTIRKMTRLGTNWIVSTLAGKAGTSGTRDGTNDVARFGFVSGLAVDASGNIYACEFTTHIVRKLAPVGTNWVVTTIAGRAGASGALDGTNGAARFTGPSNIAIDHASGTLYLTDSGDNLVRQIKPDGTNWIVSTIAGAGTAKPAPPGATDGPGVLARFRNLQNVAVDRIGNVYVGGENTVRKLTLVANEWYATTLGGRDSTGYADGTASAALFNLVGLAVDPAGDLYIADLGNHVVRKGTPALAIKPFGPNFGFQDATFGFDSGGPLGTNVQVEATTDLQNWSPISTYALPGPLAPPRRFSDGDAATSHARFYRLRSK